MCVGGGVDGGGRYVTGVQKGVVTGVVVAGVGGRGVRGQGWEETVGVHSCDDVDCCLPARERCLRLGCARLLDDATW